MSCQRGPLLLLPQYPTAEDFYKRILQRENLWQFWVLNRGDINFCICSTYYKRLYKGFYKRENLWQLWVLNRGDVNFCICSTLLWKHFMFYKGRTFDSSGFSTEGTLISASAVSHHWRILRENLWQIRVPSRWNLNFCRQNYSHELVLIFYCLISCLSHIVSIIMSRSCVEDQWSQAGIKYTCTQNKQKTVLKKAPKAIMMLADKSPKSGILHTTTTQGIWLPQNPSSWAFNSCLTQEKGEQELQSKVPNNRCVGWCNEGAKISNKESVLSDTQDTQFFSPNFSMSDGKKRLVKERNNVH